MHHQPCYWLLSPGLVVKSGIISKLSTPRRLSFLLFDLKHLLKGLAFAEFLKVDIKYLIKVVLSENNLTFSLEFQDNKRKSNPNQHNYSEIYNSVSQGHESRGETESFLLLPLPPEVTQNKVTIYRVRCYLYRVRCYLTHFTKLSFETGSRAVTHHLNSDSDSDSKSSFFEDGYKLRKWL